MSWSYSPGLVAAFLEANCSDTEQSVLSNTTHMPDQFYWPDKPTEHSRISRFGMTCEPLTGNRGEGLLTWYLEGFRAKTSALQETVPDWTAQGLGYGEKWLGSLAKYDPDTHSLKTAQCSLVEDLTGCLLTLPRSGLMFGGDCFQLPMLAHRTSVNESGYWPTPQTRFGTNDGDLIALAKMANSQEEFNQMAYLASATKKAKYWPTPQASDNRDRGNLSTPAIARRVNIGKQVSLSMCVSSQNGRLNPTWVEWLMGWPLGQTELRPLGMGKYQEFVQQHGNFCTEHPHD